MFEYVPFILGFLTGTVAQHTQGRTRTIFIALAVLLSGIIATAVSGEYLDGWGRLPLDLAQATVGLAIAFVVAGSFGPRVRGRRVR